MKKKILVFGLAMTMVMGMSLTAFAETTLEGEAGESTVESTDITGTSQFKAPTLKVEVPTTLAPVILNPYQLDYKADEDSDETSNDVFISSKETIKNFSDVPLQVDIAAFSAAATEGSNAKIATAALKETDKTNSVFVYMVVSDDDEKLGDAYDAKATNMLIAGTSAKAATKNAVGVVKRNVKTTEQDDDNDVIVDHPESIYFKVNGDIVKTPTTAWQSADGISVSVKFSFTALTVSE